MFARVFLVCSVVISHVAGAQVSPESFVDEQEVEIIRPTQSLVGRKLLNLMTNQPVEVNSDYYFSCQFRLLDNPENDRMWVTAGMVVVLKPRRGRPRWQQFGRLSHIRREDGWVLIGGDFNIGADITSVNMQINIKKKLNLAMEISSMRLTKLTKNLDWKNEANSRIDELHKGRVQLRLTNLTDFNKNQLQFKLEQINSSFPVGSAISGARMRSNSPENVKYKKFFFENFNWGVPENDLKWRMMEGTEGRLRFVNADSAIDALEDANYGSRGHCLMWGRNQKIPSWLKRKSPAAVKNTIRRRMRYIADHYGSRLDHWDVNNEQLHERWYDEKMNDPKLFSWMFKEFHELVPNSKLFVNDFYVFGNGVLTQAYKHQVVKLLNESAPVHGIGVQAHFTKNPSVEVLAKRLGVIGEAGLPIWLTEFDVDLNNEEEKLALMENVLRLSFSHPKVEGIVFWGFWNRAMWRRKSALAAGSNFELTAQGRLFKRLFFEEWRTNTVFNLPRSHTGDSFTWSTQAFYGTYRLTAMLTGETLWSREFDLHKNEDAHLDISCL